MHHGVSVVIPVFGEIHQQRLFATIDSIRAQEGVHEIIVSEQNAISTLLDLKSDPDVLHVHSRPEVRDGISLHNVAQARNDGMKHATMDHVYFNDADIVFPQSNYLRRLIETIQEQEILIRTAMYRLLLEEVPAFLQIHKEEGIEVALSRLSFGKNYQATLIHNPTLVELVEFNDRLFTSTPGTLEQYRRDLSLRGQENLLWQRIVHCGATFGKRKDLEAVGGYCSDYPVCVYEDSDLQWKLREAYTVRELHTDPTYHVLHLDHELPHRSVALEQHNKKIFETRKKRGIGACINDDVRLYQESMHIRVVDMS